MGVAQTVVVVVVVLQVAQAGLQVRVERTVAQREQTMVAMEEVQALQIQAAAVVVVDTKVVMVALALVVPLTRVVLVAEVAAQQATLEVKEVL